MSLNGVLDLLECHPDYRGNVESVGSKKERTARVRQGARAPFIASLARKHSGPMLIIAPRPEDARRLHDQLLSWLGEDEPVFLLPEPEVLPFERLAVDANTGNQRLEALAALASASDRGGEGRRPLVVCSIGSRTAVYGIARPDGGMPALCQWDSDMESWRQGQSRRGARTVDGTGVPKRAGSGEAGIVQPQGRDT